jgi:hypothetical protein
MLHNANYGAEHRLRLARQEIVTVGLQAMGHDRMTALSAELSKLLE